ncbi:MAG: tetratricopeptide repeat protein [Zoogloeaceae bacterium]|nr:tetratricopeptide repeat protein [Zoogloeaceae bacterium]
MDDTKINCDSVAECSDLELLRYCLASGRINIRQLLSLGEKLHFAGNKEAALAAFECAASANPEYVEIWHAVATLRSELGRPKAALEACNSALALNAENPESLFNTGVVLKSLGLLEPALHAYEKALVFEPEHRGALLNRSTCQMQLGLLEAAIRSGREAVDRVPDDADLWFNLGDIYTSADRHRNAWDCYERARLIEPLLIKAALAQAVSEAALGRLESATTMLFDIKEKHPEEFLNFNSPLRTDAFAAYPELESGRIALIAAYARYRNCDHGVRDSFEDLFCRVVEGGGCVPLENPDLPFLGIGLQISGHYRLRAATQVASRIARDLVKRPLQRGVHQAGSRLRVGYVSGDFRQHPTSFLCSRVFALHDRSRFEVFAYSTGPADNSEYRQQVMKNADSFVDAGRYDHYMLAQRIARDRIDILVDLQGYTLYAKPAVFALRPAPVQVSYLAYLATSGAEWIDYALLDRQVMTESERQFWSESIAYLPDTLYLCDDMLKYKKSSDPVIRNSFGLPHEAFVYCCLNAPWKIGSDDFENWGQILRAVPTSVLWLFADTPDCIPNLRERACRVGIQESRLFFAEKISHFEHLRRYAAADLFLDTHGCNAHTTAIESLACGVPVLSWPGETVVSRVGASLLYAHGLTELVVDSAVAYVEQAIRMATDTSFRERIFSVTADCTTSKVFSTQRRVREIEKAYEMMWMRHQKGLEPEDFDVSFVE